MYFIYLLIPFVLFTLWLIAYCKMRQANKEMGMGGMGGLGGVMASQLSDRITIQTMALGSKFILTLVYCNIVIGFLLAIAMIVIPF